MVIDLATIDFAPGQGGGPGEDYATKEWVQEQGYLSEDDPVISPLLEQEVVVKGNSAEFKDVGFDSFGGSQDGYTFVIDGEVYCNGMDQGIYKICKFNKETGVFDFLWTSPVPTGTAAFWQDVSGRIYIGKDYFYVTDMQIGLYTPVNLGGGDYVCQGNRHNIVRIGDFIYLIDQQNQLAYIFDEENQSFNTYSPITCDCQHLEWWYRQLNFNGHIVYVKSGNMFEFVPIFAEGSEIPTSLSCVQVSEPYYPMINNSLPTSSYVVKSNDVWYYLGNGNRGQIYYLDETQNQWVLMDNFEFPSVNFDITLYGAYANDDYVFGYGQSYASNNTMLIWYFGDDLKSYTFIKEIDDKIDAINDRLPSGQIASEDFVHNQGYTTQSNVEQYVNSSLQPYALKSYCFLNKTTTPYGPDFTTVTDMMDYDFRKYWTTPSGRLFTTIDWDSSNIYEWDNTNKQWNPISTTVWPDVPNNGFIYNTGTNVFYIDSTSTYIWDDTNSTFTYITTAPANGYTRENILITNDNLLRSSDGTKLTENGGVWSWEVSAMTDTFKAAGSFLVGSTVYVFEFDSQMYLSNFYTYDETTTTYTSLGTTAPVSQEYNCFSINGELYTASVNSRVEKWDPLQHSWIPTDIFWCQSTGTSTLYTFNYGVLWTNNTNLSDIFDFGTCGSTIYSKPEVPAGDGTYVLQATRVGDQITYEWVLNVI